jgi:hypothetical protein
MINLHYSERSQWKIPPQNDGREVTIDHTRMYGIDDSDCTSLYIGAEVQHWQKYQAIQLDFVVETWCRMQSIESKIQTFVIAVGAM